MPKIVYRANDGTDRSLEVESGITVMRAALASGVDGIVAECGGNAMCATCHVYVDPARLQNLPEMSADEDEMLECAAAERRPNSRLSCQLRVTADLNDLTVEIPETQT